MPSVTLEVGALVIVLVEWDAQPVVVEVDRPVQVLDFEEDLFDTNESHGLPLLQCRTVISSSYFPTHALSFWMARVEPWPSLISTSAFSRQNQAPNQPIWTSAPRSCLSGRRATSAPTSASSSSSALSGGRGSIRSCR